MKYFTKHTKLENRIGGLILLFALLSPFLLFLIKYVSYYSAVIFLIVVGLYGCIVEWLGDDTTYLNECTFDLVLYNLIYTLGTIFIMYPLMFYHYIRSLLI